MLGRASWRRNRIFNQSGQSQAARARCAPRAADNGQFCTTSLPVHCNVMTPRVSEQRNPIKGLREATFTEGGSATLHHGFTLHRT
jgi:hypothetical protein